MRNLTVASDSSKGSNRKEKVRRGELESASNVRLPRGLEKVQKVVKESVPKVDYLTNTQIREEEERNFSDFVILILLTVILTRLLRPHQHTTVGPE